MNVYLHIHHIKHQNHIELQDSIRYLYPKKNTIMNGDFTKILFSKNNVTMNGLYFYQAVAYQLKHLIIYINF